MAHRAARRIAWTVVVAGVSWSEARAVQETTRVSVDSTGKEANDQSWSPAISRDGRIVVFTSWATNLVAGDTNYSEDAFVFDRATGAIELADVDSNGNHAHGGGHATGISPLSADGNLVAFCSGSDDLVAGDTNRAWDVFVRDRTAGTTTRVSVDSAGGEANGDCDGATISADGRWVAFHSLASNLVAGDTNGTWDIFVRDVVSGTTERVSLDSAGVEANGGSALPAISSDGRYVAFGSVATNLDPADTNNSNDIYLRDRQLGTTELISIATGGLVAAGGASWPTVTDDGRFVAFGTATSLDPVDTNPNSDVYLRDRSSGLTTLVSVDPNGGVADSDSVQPVLTPDGSFLGFQSWASNLVAGDGNGTIDIFVRELAPGVTRRVSVKSSGHEANQFSLMGSLAANGAVTVFVSRATNLVKKDTNDTADIFVHETCGVDATWTNYGAGFAGTHGVPAFTAQQFPDFGATVTVDLANSLGAPTGGLLVVGFQRADLPTKLGGDLLVLPAVIQPITFSYGGDSFTGTIPDDEGLCGVTIDLQGIEFDPGASYGVSFSQGLELVVGR